MANQKISDRALATSLTGNEKIPLGVTGDKATTPDQLKDYIGSGVPANQTETNAGTEAAKYISPLTHRTYHTRNRVISTDAQDIAQTDDGAKIYFNSPTAIDFNIEQLTINSEIVLINIGAGVVTFVNGAGVTYSGASSLPDGSSTPTSAIITYFTATTPIILTGSGGGGGGGTWGSITGTLSSQTDLQAELTRIENLIGNSELGTGL
jgi:hypothetical protein